jgi:hypothetical protein
MFVEIGGIEPMTELSKIDQNDHIKYESSRVLALVAASSRIFFLFFPFFPSLHLFLFFFFNVLSIILLVVVL